MTNKEPTKKEIRSNRITAVITILIAIISFYLINSYSPKTDDKQTWQHSRLKY